MGTYVMLTKISAERMGTVEKLQELDDVVRTRVAERCAQVKWVSSYALLGPYDHLDIFEAPDEATAAQVAGIVRSFGYATTETWTAVPRDRLRRTQVRSDAGRVVETRTSGRDR
jgi:uncharacterized protein with GYD domain